MTDALLLALRRILADNGLAVLDDPRRVENLLKDLCPELARDRAGVMAALRSRVPQEIQATSAASPYEVLEGRLINKLLAVEPLAPDAARDAVQAWGWALGKRGKPVPVAKAKGGPPSDPLPPRLPVSPPYPPAEKTVPRGETVRVPTLVPVEVPAPPGPPPSKKATKRAERREAVPTLGHDDLAEPSREGPEKAPLGGAIVAIVLTSVRIAILLGWIAIMVFASLLARDGMTTYAGAALGVLTLQLAAAVLSLVLICYRSGWAPLVYFLVLQFDVWAAALVPGFEQAGRSAFGGTTASGTVISAAIFLAWPVVGAWVWGLFVLYSPAVGPTFHGRRGSYMDRYGKNSAVSLVAVLLAIFLPVFATVIGWQCGAFARELFPQPR